MANGPEMDRDEMEIAEAFADEESNRQREDFEYGDAPETNLEFYSDMARPDSQKFFSWLIKDLGLANLNKWDKHFVVEALEMLKQTIQFEAEDGKIAGGTFSEDILHDIYARCTVSGSEGMEKFRQFFTQYRKSTMEYKKSDQKKRLLGIGGGD